LAQPFEQAVSDPAQAHLPPTQGSPGPHAAPHAPQLSGSLPRFAHWPEHAVVAPVQTHWPPTHACDGSHALPQPPQLRGSAAVSTQLSPHAMNGLVHVEAHAPC
jgi:hypothetical protein